MCADQSGFLQTVTTKLTSDESDRMSEILECTTFDTFPQKRPVREQVTGPCITICRRTGWYRTKAHALCDDMIRPRLGLAVIH